MKHNRTDKILSIGFVLTLLLLGLFTAAGGKREFSYLEKRYLATQPSFTLERVLDGSFAEQFEEWAMDHLPGRESLTGLAALTDYAENLQVTKDIYLTKDRALVERPAAFSQQVIDRNMDAINSFAEQMGHVEFMLIPSAGYLLQDRIVGLADPYSDKEIVSSAYQIADAGHVSVIDLFPVFEGEDARKFFYKTDHHWTSRGAYEACAFYTSSKGRILPAADTYRVETADGFQGSCYSRACLWSIPPESLELWRSGASFQVEFSDKELSYEDLFFQNYLNEGDKYQVFLDGNHPLVTVRNKTPGATGKILVIRDSFSNCFGCFLADAYETVLMVDLRYYRKPIKELVETERPDDILILYSVNNFMTDGNIGWLTDG